jgi:hypothetical protein
VNQLLKRAGARSGDEVQIGGAVFDYFDDTAAAPEVPSQADADRAGRRYLEGLEGEETADAEPVRDESDLEELEAEEAAGLPDEAE